MGNKRKIIALGLASVFLIWGYNMYYSSSPANLIYGGVAIVCGLIIALLGLLLL